MNNKTPDPMTVKEFMCAKTFLGSTLQIPWLMGLALLAILGLAARPAAAAIAVADSTGAANTNASATISQAFTVNSGNVLVVNLSIRATNSTTPILPATLSWGAQTLTRAVQAGNVASQAKGSAIYYLWNPNPGSDTIAGSFPSSNPNHVISAFTLTGVDTNVSPIIATNVDQTTVSSSITSLTASNAPVGGFAALCAVSAGAANGGTFSVSPSGPTPVNWNITNFSGGDWDQGYIPSLSGGNTTFSCAFGAAGRLHIVAAVFSPAVSSTPTPTLAGQNATARTTNSATLGAIVVTNGSSAIDAYGVVYSLTSVNTNPAVGGSGVTTVQVGSSIANGSAFSTNITGLTPGTRYSFQGYAHNTSGYGYSGVSTFYAITNEPTVQASGVNISSAQRGAFTINWTRGNGNNCIVVVKAGAQGTTDPTDGTTYSPSTAFGSGSLIGTGSYVVYVGSGNTVTVSGLTIGTSYSVRVFEVNGTGGPENYLTTSPATGSATAVGNYYYSAGTSLSPAAVTSWTNILGANPANFTGGDTFIIQNGDSLLAPGTWTLSGGATLQINSGGTLDLQYDLNKLFLQGSFVNNGSFLKSIDTGTPPSVNFNNTAVTGGGTDFTSTLTVGTNYNISVLAIGGGGGGAGANNPSNSIAVQGGGGGGGASAYSANVLLQAGNAYQVTVGGNGGRGTVGTSFGNPGTAGGSSSFGGGFVTSVIANGGSGGSSGDTNGASLGGTGGAAGITGNAANFGGGSAVTGGGGGGAGADDAAAGNAASAGSGGATGSGSVAQGGAGGSATSNTAGSAGSSPGGGGSGGNWTTGAGKAGGAGAVGLVNVQFVSVSTAPNTFAYIYRSRQSGSWNDFNTWSVDKGSGFVNAVSGETPDGGHSSVVVSNSHTVTVSAAAVTVNLTVNSGATLTVSGGGLSVNRLTGQAVANNLTVNGTLNLAIDNALSLGNNTTNIVATGAVLNQTAAAAVSEGTGVQLTINGSYVQNATGSGIIPRATWGAASICTINSTFTSNIDAASNDVDLGYGQAFANFIWNAQGGTTNNVYRMTESTITNWAVGNLTISNTAGTRARLELAAIPVLSTSVTNLTVTGGEFFTGGAGSELTVNGALAISGSSTFDTGGTITALNNVSITGTADVTGSGPFRFAIAGAQSWTVTTTNELLGPAWTVNSGTALTLGSASQCTVNDLTVNGTLAVSGNSTLVVVGSSIPSTNNAGSITVASGSTLGGNGAIGASVTFSAGAFATNQVGFDTNALVNTALTLTNTLTLNGNSFRLSTGTNVLAAGDYLLITNTSGGITGSFASSPVISGAGLDVGLTGTVVTAGNSVTLHVAAAPSGPPVITSTVKSGNSLIMSGTNASGISGGTYYVRASTNVVTPIASWARISTNTYGVGGAFTVTNQIDLGTSKNFFRLEQ